MLCQRFLATDQKADHVVEKVSGLREETRSEKVSQGSGVSDTVCM